jgi:hypothetical protein
MNRSRALLVLLLLLAPESATGYVPSITKESQRPLSWRGTNCVKIRPSAVGTPDVPGDGELEAIRRAAANWNTAVKGCSYLRIEVLEPDGPAGIDFDMTGPNENTVSWIEVQAGAACRGDGDCAEGEFCDGCGGIYEPCDQREGACCPQGSHCWIHEPQAAGITTVFFIDEPGHGDDGRILDADIELNGAHLFVFSTDGRQDGTDVENTLTHELGHVMGLDHPCDDGMRSPLPRDQLGNALPSCFPESALPDVVKQSTMYNFAESGETDKRSPEADDVRGICDTYPLAQDPGQCTEVDLTPGCGCRVSRERGSPGSALPLVVLLGCVLLLRGRVRRRP